MTSIFAGAGMVDGLDTDILTGTPLKRRVAVVARGEISAATADLFGRLGAIVVQQEENEELQNLVDAAATELGRLDILVTCPSPVPDRDFLRSRPDDWLSVVGGSFYPALAGAHAAIPHMLRHSYGRIINVSPWLVRDGFGSGAHMGAIGEALHGLTRALALEFADRGIAVNTVCPLRAAGEGEKAATPEETARAITLLCVQRQDALTGRRLEVNGSLRLE